MKAISEINIRDDLYPRMKKDPALAQKYAGNIEMLPAIEINQNGDLIDGWHRLTAYRTAGFTEIPVIITETASDVETLKLAIERNAKHGQQLTDGDKKSMAIRLFNGGEGITDKKELSGILSVSVKTISRYLDFVEKRLKEDREAKIKEMWMACSTEEEIANVVGINKATVSRKAEECCNIDKCPKSNKVHALYEEETFTPPIYNIWNWGKKTNAVSHFGNSEQTIVDNLLYLYTEPFDIVVDPFAGGGSTIDICQKRSRRYWVADRKPIPAREHEIRMHDIKDGVPPLNRRWADVSLTYLDPPYWRQAEGKYSDDAEDLANQSLEDFTKNMISLVNDIAKRQSRGVIALLIQPTQWRADGKQFTDHVFDIMTGVKGATLETRISCPYNSEQYTPQMVNWAKENKKLLTLTRELIVWRCEK